MATQDAAIASPIELNTVPPGAGRDIFEIEAEQIMPFDDIRVAAPNLHRQLGKHLWLGEVVAGDDPLPARLIRQRDGDDAVPRPSGIGELEPLGRVRLDVQLQALELLEGHAQEVRLPGQHHMLRDWIGEEKIWGAERAGSPTRGFLEVRFGFVQIAPALETHQVRIKALSSQLLDV